MGQEFNFKEILPTIGYRGKWKILELITIFVLARLLLLRDFGIAFFAMACVYFIVYFMKIEYYDKDSTKVKHFYNTLAMFIPIFSVILAGLIFLFTFALSTGVLRETLRFSAVILMFSSFSLLPESFFMSRKESEKVYKVYFFSQLLMTLTSIVLAVKGYEYKAVLYGYIIFYLANIFLLWRKFPFKLKPKIYKPMLDEIKTQLSNNLSIYALPAVSSYGILILTAFAFGILDFAYIYMAYIIGFFLYENITIYMTILFLPLFKKIAENDELFRINLVRITEYASFVIVPISALIFALSREFTTFVFGSVWKSSSEIISLFVLAGMIKAIFEITRIVFIIKAKAQIIDRIKAVELISFLILFIILTKFFELNGVAISFLIASLISSALYVLLSSRFTKLNIFSLSKESFYILFAGVITALFLALLKEFFTITNLVSLALFFLLGLAIYLVLVFIVNKDIYKRIIRIIFNPGEQ